MVRTKFFLSIESLPSDHYCLEVRSLKSLAVQPFYRAIFKRNNAQISFILDLVNGALPEGNKIHNPSVETEANDVMKTFDDTVKSLDKTISKFRVLTRQIHQEYFSTESPML
jgi:hypothetical protein